MKDDVTEVMTLTTFVTSFEPLKPYNINCHSPPQIPPNLAAAQ